VDLSPDLLGDSSELTGEASIMGRLVRGDVRDADLLRTLLAETRFDCIVLHIEVVGHNHHYEKRKKYYRNLLGILLLLLAVSI
jgi:UDP-glucose 4-epimerase